MNQNFYIMKHLLKLIAVALLSIFFSSCNKDRDEVREPQTVSFETLIKNELSLYENDKYVDTESIRKALISFDQSLVLAQRTQLSNDLEIGNVFISKAKENGLEIKSDLNEPISARSLSVKIPSIPTELLNILGQFAETANANTIDQYIKNLDAFEALVKSSNLKLVEKVAILGSVITVKIIAKIVKAFPVKNNQTANEKWAKSLKCAFKSLTAGLSGSLTGCSEGASIVGGIGALAGNQGQAIGSLVGCVVGGVIQGIINIVETAQDCVEKEGLKK